MLPVVPVPSLCGHLIHIFVPGGHLSLEGRGLVSSAPIPQLPSWTEKSTSETLRMGHKAALILLESDFFI